MHCEGKETNIRWPAARLTIYEHSGHDIKNIIENMGSATDVENQGIRREIAQTFHKEMSRLNTGIMPLEI